MEELSDQTKAAIVKQVEFYFSDENLPTDAFMKKKIKAGGAQGWVPLKVVCSFPKVKKLSKDMRAIAAALEASDALVVTRATRVRRKTPFKFPDKDGMSDVISRTVVAVNIPADATAESLTPLFSTCGVAEAIRIVHKGKAGPPAVNKGDKNKEVQAPVGVHRDYATCQYGSLEEAIRAVNELTDRNSWRGGLRVTLANGVTVEKALAKLKAAAGKKAKQEQKEKERTNSRSPVQPATAPGTAGNVREGQMRSRSLTELELEHTTAAGGGGGGGAGAGGRRGTASPRAREDGGGGSSGDSGDATPPPARKPRSVSNVDALLGGGSGSGGGEGGSPPRHEMNNGGGDRLPRKGVVQTVSSEGWSWIKKDGNGSRKSGNRIPFSMADVVMKDGEEQQPLQKGDHVEYRAWRDSEGTLMAVRVERARERPRPGTGGGPGGVGVQRRTERTTQAHFRMAVGPEEGKVGFAAGRGKPITEMPPPVEAVPPASLSDGAAAPVAPVDGGNDVILRRPRGSSMGGVDSKVFVPTWTSSASQFEDAD